MIRINKYLARCGVVSRRAADDLVVEGRVTINGERVVTPGVMVDEENDTVCVDGQPVAPVTTHTYIVLNKPAGYITSHDDPHHKRTVMQLVEDTGVRINPVGRLDLDTVGVLLMTDDGELAHRLMHPRYEVKRVYRARVKGRVKQATLNKFPDGIRLPDGAVGKARATLVESSGENSVLELELTEGRKREVKHLCKAVGHPVLKLARISFGNVTAARLARGKWRRLTDAEVAGLRKLVKLDR
jgi:23S rRNA pseudouridine2605 synthase